MIPRWFLWTLLALASWGVWAVISKLIGDALTAAQSQAFSTLGLLPIIAALALARRPAEAPTARRGAAIACVAGVLACMGNIAYYHALGLGGKASTVVSLTALYPLVTVLLALLLLKEKLNALQIAGIGLALVAMYLFNVASASGLLSAWLLYALVPVALWGITGLMQKISTRHLSGEASTLWFLAAFVPVGVVILAATPWPASVSPRTWVLATALGLFFGLGNYALLAAFARGGKAAVITPLSGLYPLVSVPVAIGWFGERMGVRETVGIALALAAVAAISCESRPAETPGPTESAPSR